MPCIIECVQAFTKPLLFNGYLLPISLRSTSFFGVVNKTVSRVGSDRVKLHSQTSYWGSMVSMMGWCSYSYCGHCGHGIDVSLSLYFFFRFILYNFFLIFAHLWFGVLGLGWPGVLDWFFGVGVFSWRGFWACGVGPSGFFWVGALYVNIKE